MTLLTPLFQMEGSRFNPNEIIALKILPVMQTKDANPTHIAGDMFLSIYQKVVVKR